MFYVNSKNNFTASSFDSSRNDILLPFCRHQFKSKLFELKSIKCPSLTPQVRVRFHWIYIPEIRLLKVARSFSSEQKRHARNKSWRAILCDQWPTYKHSLAPIGYLGYHTLTEILPEGNRDEIGWFCAQNSITPSMFPTLSVFNRIEKFKLQHSLTKCGQKLADLLTRLLSKLTLDAKFTWISQWSASSFPLASLFSCTFQSNVVKFIIATTQTTWLLAKWP